jgi:hypothetical protein
MQSVFHVQLTILAPINLIRIVLDVKINSFTCHLWDLFLYFILL